MLSDVVALLEEALANGDASPETLYAWFLGEREVIIQTIEEAKAANENEQEHIAKSDLALAFDRAENETAQRFRNQTCSMEDIEGVQTCPICYFRRSVLSHLQQETIS